MRRFGNAVALAAAINLAGCQTLDGVNVNGVNLGEIQQAQGGAEQEQSFCRRNLAVCIGGGVLALALVIGVIAASQAANVALAP